MALLRNTGLTAALAVCVMLAGAAGTRAEPVTVDTSAGKRLIAIGDTLSLNLRIERERGVELRPVAVPEKLGEFVVRDVRHGVDRPVGEGLERNVSILLTIFETGQHTIPAVPVLYAGADGAPGRIESEPLDVVVESVLPEDSTEIRDIKPPLSVAKRWKEIILSFALLVGLAGAAATSVLVSLKKKSELEVLARRIWEKITAPFRAFMAWLLTLMGLRKKPAPLSYDIEIAGLGIPPEQAALEELARIDALGLAEKGLVKDLYTLVSEVMRRYIERKYGVLAMELPTTDMLRYIAGRGLMSSCYDRLSELLLECDLVKFAKHLPQGESVTALTGRARVIVRSTSERPAPGMDLEA
jgi:hypothetical protein